MKLMVDFQIYLKSLQISSPFVGLPVAMETNAAEFSFSGFEQIFLDIITVQLCAAEN